MDQQEQVKIKTGLRNSDGLVRRSIYEPAE
ncbi:predicted protein [Sclerotinia sclerotiorum 1980 UF-70]|uniref:Uncharacterized protein n=1 Tax=Sclerotinia sclerotiorum (strain ATCC 18683 / 1980 / Ss-1) TaxID=665079 RepID=A7E5U3_SCLS1|nr:predicted protein [Sclerotinia sclerotiorum 1980 UF-70]EDN91265.1 predicted protein [Sclerotinia sclerotiorum 1980 UF-70]